MGMTHQLPLEGVVEAVIAGVKEGSQAYGVKANLIGIMSRTFGQKPVKKKNALLAHKMILKHWILLEMSLVFRAIYLLITLKST